MKKPQRFLSLRKIAALFPLDTSLSIVKLQSLPQSLQNAIQDYALSQDSQESEHTAFYDYVLVWLANEEQEPTCGAGADTTEIEASPLSVEHIYGWQLLSKLNGALHLTEAFVTAHPLFKYVTIGLSSDVPSSLLNVTSPAQLSKLQALLHDSASWVLSLTQSPSQMQKTLKQEHIDIRAVTATDEADEQIGSIVLALSVPLKNALEQKTLEAQQNGQEIVAEGKIVEEEAVASVDTVETTETTETTDSTEVLPSRSTGVLYLDRMQRALASVKESAQQARPLPSAELPQAEYFMSLALQEAQKAFDLGEIPVGAVLVDTRGEVVARGYNLTITSHDITSHAEMEVFRKAGQKLQNHRLNELTLYVTLEPCCMCAMAAIHARIKRIVYGVSEPKTGACGSQFSLTQDRRHNHQLEVFSGVLADKCRKLLQDFFMLRRTEQ